MTKPRISLHADPCRLCKRSVTDRKYCEMFIILVWEAQEAPNGLEKVREVGQQGVGGVIKLLTCYLKLQTFFICLKKVGKIIDFLCTSVSL